MHRLSYNKDFDHVMQPRFVDFARKFLSNSIPVIRQQDIYGYRSKLYLTQSRVSAVYYVCLLTNLGANFDDAHGLVIQATFTLRQGKLKTEISF